MRAVRWHGKHDIRVDRVPDPEIVNPRDAIVRVTSTAICGSDLHLYNGMIPTMQEGDILGHEFMGEIVALGRDVTNLKVGDRVVIPFTIACGQCFFCEATLTSLCDNSNPADNQDIAEALMGHAPSGLFGYSHMMGGYAGGQAEFVRVPFADTGAFKVPAHLSDDQVLFLTDILPTGWMAAENAEIGEGDTVAVWGAGPVGQFAVRSAFLLGAERVIVIDHREARLELAAGAGAEPLDFEEVDIMAALAEMTGGRGPDRCIDAVGMEAHGLAIDNLYDLGKQKAGVGTDRPHVLRQAMVACRKGGTISMPGVYGGLVDGLPMGAFVNKGLTLKTGQTHVHRYLAPLLERIERGDIKPDVIISHRLDLDEAPAAYKGFAERQDEFTKVVLHP
jgi:threonine dehydrogenase-like Zn-dependent dehydrogenase